MTWPNGTRCFYQPYNATTCLLIKEELPNGKAIVYSYNEKGGLLEMRSQDRSGAYSYATISCTGPARYKSSSGHTAELSYESRLITGAFKKKHHKESRSLPFWLMTRADNPYYANTATYNERTQLLSYNGMMKGKKKNLGMKNMITILFILFDE